MNKFYLSLTKPQNKLATEIAEVVKYYYPVGVDINSEEYNKYSGIIELSNKIGEHMIDYNTYVKPWKLFLINLLKGFKSKVHNYGLPHQSSYGGELTLEKYEDNSLIRKKKIIFNVSWLGNFYTIYGVDETTIKDETNGRGLSYRAINVITISPYKEFEKAFNYIRGAIEKEFTGHKFIPFRLCCFYIKDMQLPYSYILLIQQFIMRFSPNR